MSTDRKMEIYINQKVEEFKQDLIKRLNEKENGWRPEEGQPFYYLDNLNEVSKTVWEDCLDEEALFRVGKAFKTREEAEFESERRKIEVILKRNSCKFEEGKEFCVFYYDYLEKYVRITDFHRYMHSPYFFESEEKIEEVISEIGIDRLKKIWFGIEE